jgi:hypothetical protein
MFPNAHQTVNMYITFSLLTYALIFISGSLMSLLIKRKDLVVSYFFKCLKFLKTYIYADVCSSLFFFYFDDGKEKGIYLKMDSMQKFNYFNLCWLILIMILFISPLVYYKRYYYTNRNTCLIICPHYLKFKYYVINEVIYLFLTLGFVLMSFLVSYSKFSYELSFGLFYMFMLLITCLIIAYLIKPYHVRLFNKIHMSSIAFPLVILILALLNIIYSNLNHSSLINFVHIFYYCWIGVTFLFLILIAGFYLRSSEKNEKDSHNSEDLCINSTLIESEMSESTI